MNWLAFRYGLTLTLLLTGFALVIGLAVPLTSQACGDRTLCGHCGHERLEGPLGAKATLPAGPIG